MNTYAPTPGLADHTAQLNSIVANNKKFALAPGSVWNIGGMVEWVSDRFVTTDYENPATLRRTGSAIRLSVINGEDITVENLRFDWNMGGVWREYNSCISFHPPASSGVVGYDRVQNIMLRGLRFIESTSPGIHTPGDSWCINLSHFGSSNIPQDIKNVKILGCSTDSIVQLTGGGSLRGTWDGVEIAYNQVLNGYAASIGMSSQAETVLGYETVWSNVHVHHNFFITPYTLGVFIGMDGGSTLDGTVQIDNLLIEDNMFRLGLPPSFGLTPYAFPSAILIRPGNEVGYTASATVRRNTFDLAPANKLGVSAASIQYQCQNTGNTLLFEDNRLNGRGNTVFQNVEITQSGNEYLSGLPWTIS